MRSPDVLSAGVAWDVFTGHTRQWMVLAAQADRVFYSQIRSDLVASRGSFKKEDYSLDSAWEWRLGVEWTVPTGCWSGCGELFQLRAGLHSQASGSLAFHGSDGAEAALFPGAKRRLLWAFGGSVGFRVGLPLRLDAAVQFGPNVPTTVLLGFAVRYGVSFADAGAR
jgi:hypothetical protein